MPTYTSQIFIDESGTARQTPYLVYGALKFGSDIGIVINQLASSRDKAGWRDEAKFAATNKTTLPFYEAVIDILAASTARFSAVLKDFGANPGPQVPQWKSQAWHTIEAIKHAMSNNEHAAASVDYVSVPMSENYERYIQSGANPKFDG